MVVVWILSSAWRIIFTASVQSVISVRKVGREPIPERIISARIFPSFSSPPLTAPESVFSSGLCSKDALTASMSVMDPGVMVRYLSTVDCGIPRSWSIEVSFWGVRTRQFVGIWLLSARTRTEKALPPVEPKMVR